MSKFSEENFQRAKNANGMCLPKNIENLDEILKGVNKLAWLEQGKSYSDWFKETVRYKNNPDNLLRGEK